MRRTDPASPSSSTSRCRRARCGPLAVDLQPGEGHGSGTTAAKARIGVVDPLALDELRDEHDQRRVLLDAGLPRRPAGVADGAHDGAAARRARSSRALLLGQADDLVDLPAFGRTAGGSSGRMPLLAVLRVVVVAVVQRGDLAARRAREASSTGSLSPRCSEKRTGVGQARDLLVDPVRDERGPVDGGPVGRERLELLLARGTGVVVRSRPARGVEVAVAERVRDAGRRPVGQPEDGSAAAAAARFGSRRRLARRPRTRPRAGTPELSAPTGCGRRSSGPRRARGGCRAP